jgi:hypothetical protein
MESATAPKTRESSFRQGFRRCQTCGYCDRWATRLRWMLTTALKSSIIFEFRESFRNSQMYGIWYSTASRNVQRPRSRQIGIQSNPATTCMEVCPPELDMRLGADTDRRYLSSLQYARPQALDFCTNAARPAILQGSLA